MYVLGFDGGIYTFAAEPSQAAQTPGPSHMGWWNVVMPIAVIGFAGGFVYLILRFRGAGRRG